MNNVLIWKATLFQALALALALVAATTNPVVAQLYINEIFFDPGGAGQDNRDEYIELRGTPGFSLANHYLIFVEHEDNDVHSGAAGQIEDIFSLGSLAIGSNGFLLLRQDGNLYDDSSIAPGTTNIEHDDSNPAIVNGWGNGPSSLAFHSGISNAGTAKISLENGGATAMLIHDHGGLVPSLDFDLDKDNDGLDSRTNSLQAPLDDWASKWTILDSIGFMENDELLYGRMYGQVNFAPERIGDEIVEDLPVVLTPELLAMRSEPGSDYAGLGFEIEMLARWGNSVGQTAADWHATNLTENPASGSAGVTVGPPPVIDFRQSGDHPPEEVPPNPNTPAPQPAFIESSKGVPYGTKLTTSLGAPNYITGDFNDNGVVDTADYVMWRKTTGVLGTESNHPAADANHDFLVNEADYTLWAANFGAPNNNVAGSGSNLGSLTVPEPASILLLVLMPLLLNCLRKRRQF